MGHEPHRCEFFEKPIAFDAYLECQRPGLVNIRKIKPSDAAKIAQWLSDERIADFNPCEIGPEALSQANFWASGQPHTATFVAEDKRGPTGVLICAGTPYHKAAHWCSLTLIVDPKRWGEGIGTQLLHAAEAWAKGAGIERFVVELFENPAQPWFERRGFIAYFRTESALKIEHRFRASIKLKKEVPC